MKLLKILILVIFTVLYGCESLQQRQDKAIALAAQAGFIYEQVLSGQFLLSTYKKIKPADKELIVYIEGDGYAWKRKNILSDDPTPKDPVALELAIKDPRGSILYIARPCQYLSKDQLVQCQPKYWSSHRYSEEVIDSINNEIERAKQDSGIKSINLIGYSGGGTVAVLVAALRNDVSSIITVAANIDHTSWTSLHGITPLTGSLNAANYASATENIPQLHFSGGKDTTVPPEISESYLDKVNNTANIKISVIPDFSHKCCWVDKWETLLCKNRILESKYCESNN